MPRSGEERREEREGGRKGETDGGGSSDRVWVLRRSGAMCSVSSSDLSFLDPPPSRYSGGSLERGKGARYTRCTCTRHAFLRGVSSRERNQKGRQINGIEEERVAPSEEGEEREIEGERETKKEERNLFGALSGYAKVDKRHK